MKETYTLLYAKKDHIYYTRKYVDELQYILERPIQEKFSVVQLWDADVLEKKRQDLDQLPVEQRQVQELLCH